MDLVMLPEQWTGSWWQDCGCSGGPSRPWRREGKEQAQAKRNEDGTTVFPGFSLLELGMMGEGDEAVGALWNPWVA